MLLSQIALVPLQSGRMTASFASFSTSSWFSRAPRGVTGAPGTAGGHPRPGWLVGGEVRRDRMTHWSCPPGQLSPGWGTLAERS